MASRSGVLRNLIRTGGETSSRLADSGDELLAQAYNARKRKPRPLKFSFRTRARTPTRSAVARRNWQGVEELRLVPARAIPSIRLFDVGSARAYLRSAGEPVQGTQHPRSLQAMSFVSLLAPCHCAISHETSRLKYPARRRNTPSPSNTREHQDSQPRYCHCD